MPSDTRGSICMVLVYKATVAIASSQCSGFGKVISHAQLVLQHVLRYSLPT